MLRKTILCALATAAMVPATAALAQRGGGHGGGPPSGSGGPSNAGGFGASGPGGMGNSGGFGQGGMSDFGTSMRDQARMNSQGPDHASPTGIAHANENSVLAGTSATNRVSSGMLSGLTTGMTLFSNGTPVGTVQQIRTNGNGSVVVVLVKGTNWHLFAVPANKLTLNGGTLTTMARLVGINDSQSTGFAMRAQARANSQGPLHASATGIAHANQNSVLAGASTSTRLTGVTSGMAVLQNGTQIGTVQRVVTNGQGLIVRVLVRGASGRIFSLSPTQLSLSGGMLTTTGIRG